MCRAAKSDYTVWWQICIASNLIDAHTQKSRIIRLYSHMFMYIKLSAHSRQSLKQRNVATFYQVTFFRHTSIGPYRGFTNRSDTSVFNIYHIVMPQTMKALNTQLFLLTIARTKIRGHHDTHWGYATNSIAMTDVVRVTDAV